MAEHTSPSSSNDASYQDPPNIEENAAQGFINTRLPVSNYAYPTGQLLSEDSNPFESENHWLAYGTAGADVAPFTQAESGSTSIPRTDPLTDQAVPFDLGLAALNAGVTFNATSSDMGWYEIQGVAPDFSDFLPVHEGTQPDLQHTFFDDIQDLSFAEDTLTQADYVPQPVLPSASEPFTPPLTATTLTTPISYSPLLCETLDGNDPAADACWSSVQSRSHANNRTFLFGVTTTKIFCRPSCPSRRPCRKNIIIFFFPGAIEAASHAGFRACKRCKPEAVEVLEPGIRGVVEVLRLIHADASDVFGPPGSHGHDGTDQQLQRAKGMDMRLESLACCAKLSPFHFHRLFKTITLLTPADLIAAARSLALGDALGLDSQVNATAASASALIQGSTKWKPRTARKSLGNVSPAEYASGCPSLAVHATSWSPTPFGPVSVACHPGGDGCGYADGGVLSIMLGEEAEERLRRRFPGIVAHGTSLVTTTDATHKGAKFGTEEDAQAAEKVARISRAVRAVYDEVARSDREGDVPSDLSAWLWRCRIWVRLVKG